jgi:hypothetical protein
MDSLRKKEATHPVVRTRVSIDMDCSCYPLLKQIEKEFIPVWVKTAVDIMALALAGGNKRAQRMHEDSQSRSRLVVHKRSKHKAANVIKIRVNVPKARFAYRYVAALEEREFRAWIHNALDFMASCLLDNARQESGAISSEKTQVRTPSPRATEPKAIAPGATKVSDIGEKKDDFLEMLSDVSRWAK